MSSPLSGIESSAEAFTDITEDAVKQARALATQTAKQMDAGEYGLDAWSKSMSQFFDIIARGSAAHFTTVIAGPCAGSGDSEIPPSEEEIDVTQVRDYPRKISIIRPFKDVVRPDVIIPNYSVEITSPSVVPANAMQFTLKVRLKDMQYIGRNYAARLALTPTAETKPGTLTVDYQVVTVAL